MGDLVEQLRSGAVKTSEASKMWAQAKSRRQGDGSRDDLYMWTKPEDTVEWKAANRIEALEAENARMVALLGPEIAPLTNSALRARIAELEACLGDDLTAAYMAGLKEGEARIADERVDAARAMQGVCAKKAADYHSKLTGDDRSLRIRSAMSKLIAVSIHTLDPEQFREKK